MKLKKHNFIGIFDSGIGGISVLNSSIKHMPYENYVYYADTQNFPYGKKSKKMLTNIGLGILSRFFNLNAKETIIACNTMSTSNMALFKKAFPKMNIIGTFPDFTSIFNPNSVISQKTLFFDRKNGIKYRNFKTKLLIIATTATTKSEFLIDLIDQFSDIIDIYIEPADFIVKAVENDKLETFEFDNELRDCFKEYYDIDYLLLGCTHFPHAIKQIKKYVNNNTVFCSGGDIAADNAYIYLQQNNLLENNEKPYIKIVDYNLDDNKIDLYKNLIKTTNHDITFYKEFNEVI